MKRLLITFTLLASLFSSGFNNGPNQTPARANDPITAPNNYLNLGAEWTDAVWITKKNPERPKDEPQVRNPIIFFNANPEYEIDYIKHINYRISSDNKIYDGRVDYDKNFTSIFYTERKWLPSPLPSRWPVTTIKYEYQNNSFVKTAEEESISPAAYAAYTQVYYVTYPEMGKVDYGIKKLYSLLGHIDDKIPTRLLWEYKTSKNGFNNYQDFNQNFTGGKNYKYYLILPLESTKEITVDYLSLEAYDVHGNLITDKLDIDYDVPFNPTPDDPNSTPLENVSKFSFIKEDKKLVTTHAAYFPGSNKFKIVGLQMTNYVSEDNENYPVYLFAGDLVGKKTIEIETGITREWKFINTDDELRYTTYEFQGRNNSLLIDIPLEVTDVTIDVYYQRINIVEGEELEPFSFNLTDNDGNFGVRGGVPLDDDPNKGSKILDWLKNLFSFDKGVGIFGSIKNTIGTLMIAILAGLFIYLIVLAVMAIRRK